MKQTSGVFAFPDMTVQGGTIGGVRVIPSDSLPQLAAGSPTILRDVALVVDADGIVFDDLAMTLDTSTSATIEMSTTPTQSSTLTGSPQVPHAANLVSLYQSNAAAIKATRWFGVEAFRASVIVLSGVAW